MGEFGDGLSCDSVCAGEGKVCSEKDLYIPTDNELLKICTDLGLKPNGVSHGTWGIRPIFHANGKCYGFGSSSGLSCSETNTRSAARRICPCKGTYSLLIKIVSF